MGYVMIGVEYGSPIDPSHIAEMCHCCLYGWMTYHAPYPMLFFVLSWRIKDGHVDDGDFNSIWQRTIIVRAARVDGHVNLKDDVD